MRKPVFGVSNQVRHKPGCTATQDGWMLEVSDLGSRGIVLSCSENKDADQLRGYPEADMRLCFRIYAKSRFSHDAAQTTFKTLMDVCRQDTCTLPGKPKYLRIKQQKIRIELLNVGSNPTFL